MPHMSALALFDYLTAQADLTTQEFEHLQECADCREHALQLRRQIEVHGSIDKARRAVVAAENESRTVTDLPDKDTYAA